MRVLVYARMRTCVCVGARAFAWWLNPRPNSNPPLHDLFLDSQILIFFGGGSDIEL